MPRRGWIDKKSAQHFTLVHRPQNDPLIHDDTAPSMVLQPKAGPSQIKNLDDLASEFGSEAQSIRDNEGEAANHGIYYDDTEYDYMQHMRDLGHDGTGVATFVESTASKNLNKGKGKAPLEDALRQMDLRDKSEGMLGREMVPATNLQSLSYQAQQAVPDSIAGFQPDMDPRLREVLEALEDDAYVEDDEDIFQELSKDAQELNDHDFEDTYDDFDDEGWQSDHTAKPSKEYKNEAEDPAIPDLVDADGKPVTSAPSQDWLAGFKQFKKDQKAEAKKPIAPSQAELQSSLFTTTTNGGRTKKRKGALTNPSAYSMTSSSLVRTEGLTILDGRFDKIEETYSEMGDDEGGSIVSGLSTMSSVQGPMRSDFDGIMDEFLSTHVIKGKRRVKRGKEQSGVAELDEIRKGLGPARFRTKTRGAVS